MRDILTILRGKQGMVLFLVLSTLVLLMALIINFRSDQGLDLQHAYNFQSALQAQYLGDAGIQAAIACMAQDKTPEWDSEDDDWWKDFNEYQVMAPTFLQGLQINAKLVDECSKLNLNDLVYKDQQSGDYVIDKLKMDQFKRLFDILGIDYNPTDLDDLGYAIADWVDQDDKPNASGGAEDEYYQTQSPPYAAKNGPFDCPEELLLVRGMKKEWLYGVKDKYDGILNYVTAGKPGTGTDNPGQMINLNTAPAEVLRALLDGVTPQMADKLIKDRPMKNKNDVTNELNKLGIDALVSKLSTNEQGELNKMIAPASSRFSIKVTSTLATGAEMNVYAVINRTPSTGSSGVNNKPQIVYYRID